MEMTFHYKDLTEQYLNFCTNRKNLDQKTIKSYRIDLQQYNDYLQINTLGWVEKCSIE